VIIPRKILGASFHDDPAVLDDVAPVDGLQALAHVLFSDQERNLLFDFLEPVEEIGHERRLQSTGRLV
jgi:hypothetical protein